MIKVKGTSLAIQYRREIETTRERPTRFMRNQPRGEKGDTVDISPDARARVIDGLRRPLAMAVSRMREPDMRELGRLVSAAEAEHETARTMQTDTLKAACARGAYDFDDPAKRFRAAEKILDQLAGRAVRPR